LIHHLKRGGLLVLGKHFARHRAQLDGNAEIGLEDRILGEKLALLVGNADGELGPGFFLAMAEWNGASVKAKITDGGGAFRLARAFCPRGAGATKNRKDGEES